MTTRLEDLKERQQIAKSRLFVRLEDGTEYLQLLTVTGITTVLVTRLYLEITGYPQLGGGSLHIAHVLWGGLFMLAGLVAALLFVGRGARTWSALLGGVGVGLFIDEIGKFVTSTNDYFYRPAAGIIYAVFALLVVASSLINRDRLTDVPERKVNAAMIATTGLASGISPHQRAEAARILEGHDDPQSNAVRALLDTVEERRHSPLYKKVVDPCRAAFRWLLRQGWFAPLVVIAFTIQSFVFTVVFAGDALTTATREDAEEFVEYGAIYASGTSIAVAAVISVIGLVRMIHDRRAAYGWFRTAILIDLLLAQIFNFTGEQFGAVVGLPFVLVAYAVVAHELRENTGELVEPDKS